MNHSCHHIGNSMEAFNYLLPLAFISAAMLASAAWVLLRSQVSNLWKFICVVMAFALAVAIPLSVSHMFGKAFPVKQLPERAMLVAHRTIIEQGKKVRIEVWIVEKKSGTRLVSVPYAKQLEEQLKEAEKARQQGIQTELFRKEKKGNADADHRDGTGHPEYGLDFKRPEDVMPGKTEP